MEVMAADGAARMKWRRAADVPLEERMWCEWRVVGCLSAQTDPQPVRAKRLFPI